MRAFLAFQVCSTSMVELGKNYADEVDGIDNYQSTISISSKMDRLIDIRNGNHAKGYGPIDSPDHVHLDELEQISKESCEWKIEAS